MAVTGHTRCATGWRGRRDTSGRSARSTLSEENDTNMTTNLLNGKPAKASAADANASPAIGENDSHIFNCPSCTRPLAEGTPKCPGCGVRLVMGVMLKRAGGILALGIVIGVLAGGATTAAAISLSLPKDKVVAPAVVAPATAPNGARVSAAPTLPAGNAVIGAPQAAVAALSGTAVVNGRIAVDAATLSSTLAAPNASSIEIARAFRSLAADSALGVDVAARLGSWHEAGAVMADLEVFYRTMADTARNALRATFADNAGYRRSGAEMLTVLAGLGKVDAASRTLGTSVGLELPPVALPRASASVSGPAASPAP
jgi:hypothetical protein